LGWAVVVVGVEIVVGVDDNGVVWVRDSCVVGIFGYSIEISFTSSMMILLLDLVFITSGVFSEFY